MALKPRQVEEYHVFLASPGDMDLERQAVRRFFEEYNRHTAGSHDIRFTVIDYENYATAGIGRPQELITGQTLEKYRDSLALVVGLMGQRFGSATGTHESGTEEEFEWALNSYARSLQAACSLQRSSGLRALCVRPAQGGAHMKIKLYQQMPTFPK